MRNVWPPLVVLIVVVIGWHFAKVGFQIPDFLLPSPADLVREFGNSWPRVKLHTWATLKLTLLGFTIGCTIGAMFACVLHPFRRLKAAFNPLIVMSQTIPIIVLGPLLMTWLGIGLFPKVLIIVLVCFFPVLISMTNGLTQTNKVMLNYMQMIGASKWQSFWKLELPHALPYLFAGLKISATYSVLGAIMAEWIGADVGIGKYLILQQSAFRIDRVFIATGIIILLSLLLFSLTALLERLLTRGRPTHGQS